MGVRRPLELRSVGLTAGTAVGLTGTVAILTALAFGAHARRWLGLGFGGVPANLGEALAIFLNNARLVGAVAIAALLAQGRQREPASRWLRLDTRLLCGLSRACELGLLAAGAANIALIGLALGAYGSRMLVATLPHGPFELGAYCIAVTFYLEARRNAVPARAWIAPAVITLSLLAFAAFLETFAWLR